ncbi:MAG TPA: hypothetical protein VMX33_11775 [bacterium]|nr:hypothetical protein [bacterium]
MDDLLRLLPAIRRIRGNRLYAADGTRLLDMWLDDSRGILGDRDRFARTHASNAADKGLTRPYPGLHDTRFRKALESVWPGFGTVRVFGSEERALRAARDVLCAAGPENEQAAEPFAEARFVLARPFAAIPALAMIAMPRLPCPRPFSPWCLMARDGSPEAQSLALVPGDIVPAQSLYAAASGLARVGSAIRDGYGEEMWRSFGARLDEWFERRGPYLFARVAEPDYTDFFKTALAGGALLSPRPDAPSIVPPDWDDGELVRLARALQTIHKA